MSRVCRSWRQVSSEPILWREVNLSAMSIECPRSATDYTIEKLACSRLKAVKDLNLDGWNELTDTGLKVKNQCQGTKEKQIRQYNLRRLATVCSNFPTAIL